MCVVFQPPRWGQLIYSHHVMSRSCWRGKTLLSVHSVRCGRVFAQRVAALDACVHMGQGQQRCSISGAFWPLGYVPYDFAAVRL